MLCVLVGAAVVLDRSGQESQDDQRTDRAPAADPHAGHTMVPNLVPAAVTTAAPLPRTGWSVTTDSAQDTAPRVLDDDPATSWRSAATAMPHHLTVDTHNRVALSGLTYLPPDDTDEGRIGQYRVQISDDGTTWSTPVATGTFADDEVLKTVTIGTVVTRFVRLTALTEAGDRGPWAAAAEVNLLGGTDPALPRTAWTVTPDTQETAALDGRAVNAIDGNTNTFWHTRYSPAPAAPLPHNLLIRLRATNLVSGLAYLPRQDASKNGQIGRYRVETSLNGADWVTVVTSSFTDSKSAQTVTFASQMASYVRLTALSESGNRGPWSSAAEINVLGRANPTLSRTGWTATASSQEAAYPASLALDDNAATLWHSRYSPAPAAPLPHTLQIDMKQVVPIGGLSYLPRPAAGVNGRIGRYRIETSVDNSTWSVRIQDGTFPDSAAQKAVLFPPVDARYVRLVGLTEAGNRGPWSTAAEVYLLGPSGSVVPKRGTWSAPTGFPLVPVAAALLPNGKVLTWSAYRPDAFSNGTGRTVTATYDPATGVVTQRTVAETGHDMFCPGISTLPDGRVLVTGGNNSEKTSIYDPRTDAWTAGPNMKTPRGYQASVTLADGRVFTIGGSWSGPRGGTGGVPHKSGEVWSAGGGWKALPAADAAPMLTADANPLGDYRKDNHAWLFTWSDGKILQAGPSKRMNWYTADGNGSVALAGTRGTADAMNGTAVMYDTGKILAMGGATSYEGVEATADTYLLTVRGTTVSTRKVSSMANTRAFHNSVVLPDGKVVVVGGQNFPVPFSDNTAVLSAEIWDPVSESFSTMATATVPRTYHSVALLLPDGRVWSGGGGLCGTGCANNHFDGQIFTPPYLIAEDGGPASRPVLTDVPAQAGNGDTVTVRTDRAVTGFAIVRTGTATHSVNTDQRRVSLTPTQTADGGYELTIPADSGVAVPGYWMLFALDAKGVPSTAKILRIG